ncbi:hypothetical protein BDN70DRAFT_878593 [Pholiota conissans]|uniref:Zn(2)-C6 fungal-type domain-containing protein n=1 Tax=Pholiota conissans TaxID=109636 RepID=A0A9P5Z1E9_9AGAR|nr:hypothetical protein BDN70DRAFT_878593 [Pholiota conissans]
MSSNEDEFNDENTGGYQKKRRIQRACDICRRKKIRCDGVQMPGNRCSNCIAYSFDCTYVEAAKKRGPPKGYVESLENRLEKLEKLLKRLCPDEALYKTLTESLDNNNWMTEKIPFDPSSLVGTSAVADQSPHSCGSHSGTQTFRAGLHTVTSAIRGVTNNANPPTGTGLTDDEEDTALILADNMKRMELDPHEYRFFGKSSGAMLVRTALELKSEYTGVERIIPDLSRSQLKNLRPEFWGIRPWERLYAAFEEPKYVFPEPDLSRELVDLYYKHVNLYLPLLNRVMFDKWIEDGLHLTDKNFAPVYLLVCAVGARYSDDPRARLDGNDSPHSRGWKWFNQVHVVRRAALSPPTLSDLQVYCLAVQFLQGSSAPQSCWTLVGIGIRLAQDVGAHRKKLPSHKLTAEDEMWKRAFWVLVCIDRMVSSSLGRPCAIQDEDFDLELPIDCDDEYWDHPDPEQQFKQPPGKPSLIAAFILTLKLNQILAFSLRTIYSINKSKILLGFVGQQWEQHIVAELDSALNKWVDSVPDHLRWDPNRENEPFFAQSVALYAGYYHIQILIHRPFIPSPSKPSPLSFPSLAICTNAARSCCHVIDIQRRRNGISTPQVQMAVFTSGIVLLLSIWGGKRSGLSTDPNREMAEVHKCMQVLRMSETRWHSTGRLWDILYELASVGELPLPQASPPATNKRERDSETPISATPGELSSQKHTPVETMPRSIAGSRRVNKDSSFANSAGSIPPSFPPQQHPSLGNVVADSKPALRHRASSSTLQSTAASPIPLASSELPLPLVDSPPSLGPRPPHAPVQYYALPVYSNELGRLPLHGQVAFSADAPLQQPSNLQPQPGMNYWSPPVSGNNLGVGIAGSSTTTNTGFPSMSDMSTMSSMTTGYEMDSTAIAAGMMFDTMAGTLPFNHHRQHSHHAHRHSLHHGEQVGGPAVGVGSYGMSDIEGGGNPMDGFRGIGMDTTGGMGGASGSRNVLGEHLGQPGQGSSHQPDLTYPFVDNDTIAMWSTAPCGFELDEWGTYLTNVSEITQHGHQLPLGTPNDNPDGMQHQ